MEHLNIILPGLLVLIAFLLKLIVNQEVDIPKTIESLLGLPVDIVFLALTFSVAFTLSSVENQREGLFYCFVGFIIAMIVVLFWKISQSLFVDKRKIWILLLFINLTLAGFAVYKSIEILTNSEDPQKIENTNNKDNNFENQ